MDATPTKATPTHIIFYLHATALLIIVMEKEMFVMLAEVLDTHFCLSSFQVLQDGVVDEDVLPLQVTWHIYSRHMTVIAVTQLIYSHHTTFIAVTRHIYSHHMTYL